MYAFLYERKEIPIEKIETQGIIKVRNYRITKFYIGLIVGMMVLGVIQITFTTESQETDILYDEIHTFNPPGNLLIIDALFFQEKWYYELSFEVVSPHQCQTNISIIDPDGFCYNIYSGIIQEKLFSFSFGATCSGLHSLNIELKTNDTLNFRVEVKKIGEIIDIHAISGRIIEAKTFRFSPNVSRHKVAFRLDKHNLYSIELFKITPIPLDSQPFINVSIQDSRFQTFSLYQGTLEKNLEFKFQTSIHGDHLLITEMPMIKSPLSAMIIIYIYSTNSNIQYSVPYEAQVLSASILFCSLLIPYLIVRKSKR